MTSPDEMFNPITKPKHYNTHPSGVECIQVAEHMNFCLGNAIKYLWRAGEKGETLEDLKKARWYVDREIERLEKKKKYPPAQTHRYESPLKTAIKTLLPDIETSKDFQVRWELPFEYCEGCYSHVCRTTGACMHKVDDPH